VAPTAETIAEMALYVRIFRDRGGTIRLPPHPLEDRLRWVAAAKSRRESWDYLPVMLRTERLKSGLAFMWAALRHPRCIVAFLGAEPVAALSYDVRMERIEAHVAGSLQADYARGAGTTLELALADEAIRRGLPIHSTYTADARNFHVRIGRRLDLIRGENSSEWTFEDCQLIARGIKEAL
jgi:hypothetical protein